MDYGSVNLLEIILEIIENVRCTKKKAFGAQSNYLIRGFVSASFIQPINFVGHLLL